MKERVIALGFFDGVHLGHGALLRRAAEEAALRGLAEYINWDAIGYALSGTAHTIGEAMDLIEHEPVDVVLTDIQLEDESGLDLVGRLSKEYPRIRCVILSGHGEFEYARQAIRYGTFDFLTKPVQFDALRRTFTQLAQRLQQDSQDIGMKKEYTELKRARFFNNLAKEVHPSFDPAVALDLGIQTTGSLSLVRFRFETAGPRTVPLEGAKHKLRAAMEEQFDPAAHYEMFNNALKSKVSLVRVNTEIHKGDQITEKMITTVEVGGYNLPDNVVYRAEDVVGKYANTDLYKGDYILESKLSDAPMLKNAYLGKLNGENRAISVSIKSFAAGLSGKLEAGDIVTLIASDVGEKRETLVLPELQYVEIIATTASSGTDNDVQADVEDGEEQELASTITVLATPEQARLLAELEQTGKLHAALVFRGDSTQAEKFLDEQQKVLEELYTEELEGEAETAEADAEEEKEEPIVDDVEVNAGGQ